MLAGFTSLFLNLILPEEVEDDPEIPELTAVDSNQGGGEQYAEIGPGKEFDDGPAKSAPKSEV